LLFVVDYIVPKEYKSVRIVVVVVVVVVRLLLGDDDDDVILNVLV
jgi:hypothetical protein